MVNIDSFNIDSFLYSIHFWILTQTVPHMYKLFQLSNLSYKWGSVTHQSVGVVRSIN